MKKTLVILASPSGGGKSTVVRHLMSKFPDLKFSISATTRAKRPAESNGREYYFLTREEFGQELMKDGFVEHEEIFGNLYGTLKSEVEKAIQQGRKLIFDIDVKGALSLKRLYPDESLLIFISPPSLEVLEQRLRSRKSETEEQIQTRLSRAQMEMSLTDKFDYIIINDKLEDTLSRAEGIVKKEIY